MNRLQKKCLIASVGGHIFLVLVLLLGAAFAGRHKEDEDLPPMMTLIPSKLVDALVSGGGNPEIKAASEPAAAPTPTPPLPAIKPEPKSDPTPISKSKPEPEKVEIRKPRTKTHEIEPNYDDILNELKETEPIFPKNNSRKTPKSTKEKPTANSPSKSESKKHEIKVNLTPLKAATRSAAEVAREARHRAEAAEKQQAALEAYRLALEHRSALFDNALAHLQEGLSKGTSIEIKGPGGEAFANYGLFLRSVYDSKWEAPQDAPDDSAKVEIKVVVSRDGHIVSSEISRKSGNPSLDKSVQRVLNAVHQFPPFPVESSDRERVFILNFDLKAKRQIG